MENIVKIFAYLRVSTDKQAESGAGLAAQRDSCLKWAEALGGTVEQFYADEGVSGSTGLDRRPALLEAISQLKKGDVLVVAKRDRLGRDLILVAMIEAAVERKLAKVASAAGEGTGDNDPSSVLMRRMVDAFAEFERNVIGARTSAAMQAMRKKNERVGHVPFGFRLAEDRVHLEEDEEEQSILNQLQELIDAGLSTRQIADELNRRKSFNRGGARWNHGSIHRIRTRLAA